MTNMVSQTIRVGKKFAIHLPKKVVNELGINEGDILIAQTKKDEIILRRVESKINLIKPWSKIKPEEVEKVGEEITEQLLK